MMYLEANHQRSLCSATSRGETGIASLPSVWSDVKRAATLAKSSYQIPDLFITDSSGLEITTYARSNESIDHLLVQELLSDLL